MHAHIIPAAQGVAKLHRLQTRLARIKAELSAAHQDLGVAHLQREAAEQQVLGWKRTRRHSRKGRGARRRVRGVEH